MFTRSIYNLRNEQEILEKLSELSAKKKYDMMNVDMTELSEIPYFRGEADKSIEMAEDYRIELISMWLNITREQAIELRLSALQKDLKTRELEFDRHFLNGLVELKHILNELP